MLLWSWFHGLTLQVGLEVDKDEILRFGLSVNRDAWGSICNQHHFIMVPNIW